MVHNKFMKTKKAKILIVEDDVNLGYLLERILIEKGYLVARAKTGENALVESKKNIYSMFLIDIGLPDISGLAVVEEIRKDNPSIPIIVITDRIDAQNELESFKKKATLFHKKPLNLPLLLVQLDNYLQDYKITSCIYFKNLTLSISDQSIGVKNKSIKLNRSEFALLALFLKFPDRTYSRTDLMNKILNKNRVLTDSAIDTLISRVRKKLSILGYKDFIETLHNVGYKVSFEYLKNAN